MAAPPVLRVSRPTIAVGGTESSSLTGGLLGLCVSENAHGLSNCEAEFGNWGPNGGGPGFLFFGRRELDFGKTLEVRVADSAIFAGRITALEARYPEARPPSIVVLAEDGFQDLRMRRRTRTFVDVTDADVFTSLAGDHGLTADVAVTGPAHRVIVQLNQSDLAFMRERVRALEAELWIAGSTLSVKPRASRTGSPLTLTYGKELREFRVIADLADQATSIEVTGWDVAGKSPLDEQADASILRGELARGDSGASVLSGAFGTRTETIADTVPHTSAEARARVEATMRRRARRFVVGHAIAESQPGLRVGATVRLVGLGPLFEGDFYVAASTCRFDGLVGLRTEFEVERPWLGRPT